ncbi:hypothetical protein Y1Q_0014506 [Alligator mississippiensis]|uniref:Uncharacterized protein n=1 Tax=Alligator mississippiensis TaxID=8496 RepID=A0A151PD08_ALLMI|nr:hypothetical protein Y1Q_0014506 [Alligator mississippiensis]
MLKSTLEIAQPFCILIILLRRHNRLPYGGLSSSLLISSSVGVRAGHSIKRSQAALGPNCSLVLSWKSHKVALTNASWNSPALNHSIGLVWLEFDMCWLPSCLHQYTPGEQGSG